MDFEKNFLEIENEDDIFNLDEENRQQLGDEALESSEDFRVDEENVRADEENKNSLNEN